jgi:hypothetical protein
MRPFQVISPEQLQKVVYWAQRAIEALEAEDKS